LRMNGKANNIPIAIQAQQNPVISSDGVLLNPIS
jgi:hypothetical protein